MTSTHRQPNAVTNSPRRGDLSQIEPGKYYLKQNNFYCGHLIVVSTGGTTYNTTEHWFLYAADQGTQNKKYVWPSSATCPVTTVFQYVSGDPGSTFNGATYKQGLVNAGLTIDYIKAVCTKQ